MGWPGLGVLTRSDINQAVLPQKWFHFFFPFFLNGVFFFFFYGGFYVVKVVHCADQL